MPPHATVIQPASACKAETRDGSDMPDAGRRVQVHKKVSELEKVQFNKGQELFVQRAREKDLVSEIGGGQAQNRHLVTHIQQLDDQVIRQQELLYNVEFQLQQMERRVSRAKGERSDEESTILNEKIEGLTQQLEGVNEQHNMLLAQVKRAEDDLGKAVLASTKLTKDQSKVQEDMVALNMETDMIVRTVKSAASAAQQRLVDMDVQKLEVQKLRKVLNSKADEVFTLENKKFQLQQSLHERRHEIDVHRSASLPEDAVEIGHIAKMIHQHLLHPQLGRAFVGVMVVSHDSAAVAQADTGDRAQTAEGRLPSCDA
jgi:coiled-coil domain-containing protein 39